LTTKLLTTYKQKIASISLIPSRGGCFELSADNALIYSKLQTGTFPNEDEMVVAVGSKLAL
jgi:selenoprotein W-related protein